MDLDQFSALVEAIYAAGSDPQNWEDHVLRPLTEHLSASAAILSMRSLNGSGLNCNANFRFAPDALAALAGQYCALNPVNRPLARAPVGVAVSVEALLPRREMLRSEFYNDYTRRFKIEGTAVLPLHRGTDSMSCLSVIGVADAEPPTQSQMDMLSMLAPHLLRAFELSQRLESIQAEGNASLAALEHLDAAAFLLREKGVIAHCNTAGEALLRACDGLVASRGRIRATHPEAASTLARLIHEAVTATGGHGGFVALPRQANLPPHSARVLPVRARDRFFQLPQIGAILFVSKPGEKPHSAVEHLALAYGLTGAETRLVALLVEGQSLKEASERLQTTKETARKHLAHIMTKTGAQRQSELIRLVLTGRLPYR